MARTRVMAGPEITQVTNLAGEIKKRMKFLKENPNPRG
jgi:hypothetical protein